MGCTICKARAPATETLRLGTSPAPAINDNKATVYDKKGSSTTIAPSASPLSANNAHNRTTLGETPGSGHEMEIKRVLAPIEKEESQADPGQGGQDVVSGKAPSYRVRKSIMTARVKIGEASQIFTKYDVTNQVLGTGVSGAVRIAIEKTSGKQYAIKTLSLENISAKKAAMLHNEVDIYLKLDHPNIAKLIEVYEDEKKIYLVMELCTGRELYDRLAAKKRYSECDAAKVTQQMLEAINYCHKHRICHRDLKLENWVYANESEDAPLKLIDFGFSRIFNPVIPMTAMHGTVYYVSPEVMDGCYREKCDIWSLGVIVYMLLSGSPPFNGSVDYQILVKIRSASFNFDAPVWRTVSEEAKDFIRSLLVRDPNQRPSADEALRHPWLLKAYELDNHEINLEVLQAMRQFALGNIMKRAALGLAAYSFTNNEVQDLHKEFKKLDKEKKGVIRLQDLVAALTEHLKLSDREATRVFEMIDQTGDREVHYTEFLAATLHKKMLTDDNWMKEAFSKLDADNSGLITVKDLRAVLGDSFNNIPVETIMARCDTSGTGALDFERFRQVLTCPEGTDLLLTEESAEVKDPSAVETRASFSEAIVSMQLSTPCNS